MTVAIARGAIAGLVMQIVEERCGGVFDDIAEVLSRSELEETATAYKKQAGFDIEALNSSPLIMGVWEPVSEATA